MHRLLPALLVLALSACDYEAPVDTDEPYLAPPRISGTVLVDGLEAPATTLVLVYAADDPPPPLGTGSPLTFGVVPASAFSTSGAGLFEAPFDLGLAGVPDMDVLVTALADVDGDFYPLPPYSAVTGGATCGDISGAHVTDLQTGQLAPVSVSQNTRVDGLSVLVAREATIERPAFVFQGGSPTLTKSDLLVGETLTFRLAATGIASGRVVEDDDGNESVEPMLVLDGPFDGSDPCGTSFWVTVYDRDLDGQPDPHPDLGAAAMDAWPRVILQYQGTLNEDGTIAAPDPSEGQWVAQAAHFPAPVWMGDVPLNQPTPLNELELVWVPAARHILPDGTEEVVAPDFSGPDGVADLERIPAGVWSVTLINVAGQTWTVPNALWTLPSVSESFDPNSQRGALILE